MTLEEKKSVFDRLKIEIQYGSFNLSDTFHKLVDAYNVLLGEGYTEEEADDIINRFQSSANFEINARKKCTAFIDSIFDK